MKGHVVRLGLAFASVSAVLGVVEACLRIFAPHCLSWTPEKQWIQTRKGLGYCYSSNLRHYFPLNLLTERDRDSLQEVLIGHPDNEWGRKKEIEILAGQTPYCIITDTRKRREGANPGSLAQAAIVGDSFAYGEGLKEKDTLAYLLNDRIPSINFRNFANPGANIQDVSRQIDDVLMSQPDIDWFLYVYNLNDPLVSGAASKRLNAIVDFENVFWTGRPPTELNGWFSRALLHSALGTFYLKARFMSKVSRSTIDFYNCLYFYPENQKELTQSFAILDGINNKLLTAGKHLIIIVYPLLYKDIYGRYPFTRIHDLVASHCRHKGIAVIDAYAPFEKFYSLGQFTLHPADYHPNAAANGLVIDYIVPKLHLMLMDTRRQS